MNSYILVNLLISLSTFRCANTQEDWVYTIPEDLNAKTQLSILDKIELNDLIEIADTNQHFKVLCGIIFKRKYSKETFQVDLSFETMGGFEFFADFYIRSDFIEVLSFKIAKKLLQNFGHLISKLFIINYKPSGNEQRILLDLIDSQCTDTLKELKVTGESQSANIFDHFTKPFNRVEVLHLHGIFTCFDSSNFTFSELFPALTDLSLSDVSVQNDSIVSQHLPHLLRLNYAPAVAVSHSLTELKICRLIANNAQIVELKLTRSAQSLLRFVADELKIENLIIIEHHERELDNCIEFDSVKKLSWINATFAVPRNIVFRNLLEFETNGGLRKYANWTNFIANCSSLKKFHSIEHCLDDADFMQLAEVNRNLLEFRGRLDINVDPKNIVKFVENGANLRKVRLELHSEDDDYEENFKQIVQFLRETVPKCWRMTSNQRSLTISLRR